MRNGLVGSVCTLLAGAGVAWGQTWSPAVPADLGAAKPAETAQAPTTMLNLVPQQAPAAEAGTAGPEAAPPMMAQPGQGPASGASGAAGMPAQPGPANRGWQPQ